LTSFFQEGNALIFGVQRENVFKPQYDKTSYMNCCFVFYCFNRAYLESEEFEVKPFCKCENYLRTASHLIKFNLVVITFEN